MKKNLYEILGVEKNATEDQLKSAFRKLSMKYHPDRQQGKSDQEKKEAEEKFKEIAEAYSVLKDKEKREQYDRFGTFEGMGGRGQNIDPFEFFRKHSRDFHFDPFDDNFEFNMDGSKNNTPFDPNAPKDGEDINLKIRISFKDSIFGSSKDFTVDMEDICEECKGTGAKNAEVVDCPHCGGKGVREMRHGMMFIRQTCGYCGGSGKSIKERCPKCNGSGFIKNPHKIHIDIPEGTENGEILKIRESGPKGINGGKQGNVYIQVFVVESELFERNGPDLKTKIFIDPITATLGGDCDVFTPYGMASVKLPPNIESGKIFRICGKGIKNSMGNGDLFVEVEISPIINPSKDQIKLLEKLKKSLKDVNFSKKKCYNDMVKKFKEE